MTYDRTYALTVTRHELVALALSVSAAACASYTDERLHVAAEEYAMAARLFDVADYPETAAQKLAISLGIRREIVENAREEEDA